MAIQTGAIRIPSACWSGRIISSRPGSPALADFESAYLTVQGESDAYTQRPRIGFDYQFTQTLRAGLSAGPSFLTREDKTDVKPTISARLTQLFSFGSLRAGYDWAVTASTFGLADTQSIYVTLEANRLMRGLLFEITPRYSMADFEDRGTDSRNNRQSDVFSINLRATYQLTPSLALIGSYTYYHERSERISTNTENIDQNRVFLGVQYAFPITFY